MSIELPDLPYARDALSPRISEQTIDFHYGKHHAGYVKKVNAAIVGSDLDDLSLEELIRNSQGSLFNNAAQVWNHSFYWNSLSPTGGGQPSGALADAIHTAFGSYAEFQEQFAASAASNFGSGWTWLIKNAKGSLEIINTGNADTPLSNQKITPLLTVDVWEHAYYIDYRNDRGDYLKHFWEIVNWDFAIANLG
ncbi:MAG: Fe-Mn family superoxide dismutase [Cryomorphaceae bacterium]|jgi:Fe-Mn family superoxide dismutase